DQIGFQGGVPRISGDSRSQYVQSARKILRLVQEGRIERHDRDRIGGELVGELTARDCPIHVARFELYATSRNNDFCVTRELPSEFGCSRFGAVPITTQLVKADQLEPGRPIKLGYGARSVEEVRRFRPFLLRNRDVCEPEKGGDVARLLRKNLAIEL